MNYRAYLRGRHWKLVRARMLVMTGRRCEWPHCMDTEGLEVHHRHYDSLGHEASNDLVVLCEVHHAMVTARGRYRPRSPEIDRIVEERTWHIKQLP